jgi:hypothetical protein
MAIQIDDNFLQAVGLGSLPQEEKQKLLDHIYETLETRVGMKLAERMSEEQLDEFEGFMDTNDEMGARKWLEANFPNYPDVVKDELDRLQGELKRDAPKILATANGQAPTT